MIYFCGLILSWFCYKRRAACTCPTNSGTSWLQHAACLSVGCHVNVRGHGIHTRRRLVSSEPAVQPSPKHDTCHLSGAIHILDKSATQVRGGGLILRFLLYHDARQPYFFKITIRERYYCRIQSEFRIYLLLQLAARASQIDTILVPFTSAREFTALPGTASDNHSTRVLRSIMVIPGLCMCCVRA